MIRTKILGISSIIIITFSLLSCGSVKNIERSAVILEESYKYYINDSLTFSYRFPGDYDQITVRKEIKRNLNKVAKNLPLNNCIACFKTNIPPDLIHYIFYFPNNKQIKHGKLLNAIEKETKDFYINVNEFIVGKFIPLQNNKGSVYIIGHSKKNEFINLKGEYDDIFSHITTNENYRDITFESPFDIGRKWEILEDTTINYLMPVFQLEKCEPNYTDNYSKGDWLQAYGTFVSRLTNASNNIQATINQWRNLIYLRGRIVSADNAASTDNTALFDLIQKCKNERIVMINENHFAPNHRILAEIILDSLYNYGFRYLAMEAIWENDTMLNKRGYVVSNTGYYSREPMMANLVRKAIDKGYYVFGYDDFTSDREKNQALNIFQKTFATDSLYKVLVLAGFGHINEADGAKKMMAREFFLLSGINPLTIEQIEYVTEDAFLMVLDTATIRNRRATCDIFVANNFNYELFATKSGYKNYNINIPEEIAKQSKTQSLMFIVSIFKTNEYMKDKTAIPVYNRVLNNDLLNISIILPDNNYCYLIKNRYGEIVYQGNL